MRQVTAVTFWLTATLGAAALLILIVETMPRWEAHLSALNLKIAPLLALTLPPGIWFAAMASVALLVRRCRAHAARRSRPAMWRLAPAWVWAMMWWLPLWIPFIGLQPWDEPNPVVIILLIALCAIVSGVAVLIMTGMHDRPLSACFALASPFPLLFLGVIAGLASPRGTGWEIVFPIWGLWAAVIFGVLTAWAWEKFPALRDVCTACRYDLRGLSSTAPCPECGTDRSD